MEPNTSNVRLDYLIPVEAKNYVFVFWRRHNWISWAYYIWTVGRSVEEVDGTNLCHKIG